MSGGSVSWDEYNRLMDTSAARVRGLTAERDRERERAEKWRALCAEWEAWCPWKHDPLCEKTRAALAKESE